MYPEFHENHIVPSFYKKFLRCVSSFKNLDFQLVMTGLVHCFAIKTYFRVPNIINVFSLK